MMFFFLAEEGLGLGTGWIITYTGSKRQVSVSGRVTVTDG